METSWTLDPDEGSSLLAKSQRDEIVVLAEKETACVSVRYPFQCLI